MSQQQQQQKLLRNPKKFPLPAICNPKCESIIECNQTSVNATLCLPLILIQILLIITGLQHEFLNNLREQNKNNEEILWANLYLHLQQPRELGKHKFYSD